MPSNQREKADEERTTDVGSGFNSATVWARRGLVLLWPNFVWRVGREGIRNDRVEIIISIFKDRLARGRKLGGRPNPTRPGFFVSNLERAPIDTHLRGVKLAAGGEVGFEWHPQYITHGGVLVRPRIIHVRPSVRPFIQSSAVAIHSFNVHYGSTLVRRWCRDGLMQGCADWGAIQRKKESVGFQGLFLARGWSGRKVGAVKLGQRYLGGDGGGMEEARNSARRTLAAGHRATWLQGVWHSGVAQGWLARRHKSTSGHVEFEQGRRLQELRLSERKHCNKCMKVRYGLAEGVGRGCAAWRLADKETYEQYERTQAITRWRRRLTHRFLRGTAGLRKACSFGREEGGVGCGCWAGVSKAAAGARRGRVWCPSGKWDSANETRQLDSAGKNPAPVAHESAVGGTHIALAWSIFLRPAAANHRSGIMRDQGIRR
ncbi:hypothetical protein B0H14DRAFT_3158478 [Mycena olivaceomarginata]|nr:hypothetical protein B0H14DRAFT_3158478 [Mycena olivaceomarginata]